MEHVEFPCNDVSGVPLGFFYVIFAKKEDAERILEVGSTTIDGKKRKIEPLKTFNKVVLFLILKVKNIIIKNI